MSAQPSTRPPDETHSEAEPLRIASPAAAPAVEPDPETDTTWLDLLMYGIEHVVRGSDTGTLVAFAALVFQQIRGKSEPHHTLGCGLLLISVPMCAAVHFAIGNAYVERAKSILRGLTESRGRRVVRWASYGIAWIATLLQFSSLVAGTGLILLEHPPAFVVKHVLPLF